MQRLVLFAKHWTPGQAKTRLAASIGPNAAAEVACASLFTLLRRFATLDADRVLAFWPPEKAAEFAAAGPAWRLEPQVPGDLGTRLNAQFAAALSAGCRRVIALGSDSPTLPGELVTQAFRRLEECDVVLGPSDDGGYYLVGAAGRVPPIFAGMPWSTPALWPTTLARLAEHGLRHATLPPWYDIDDIDSLRRLAAELPSVGAEFTQLRAAVGRALPPIP